MESSASLEAKKNAFLRYKDKLLDAKTNLNNAIESIESADSMSNGAYQIDGGVDENSYYSNYKDSITSVINTLNKILAAIEQKIVELNKKISEAMKNEGIAYMEEPVSSLDSLGRSGVGNLYSSTTGNVSISNPTIYSGRDRL